MEIGDISKNPYFNIAKYVQRIVKAKQTQVIYIVRGKILYVNNTFIIRGTKQLIIITIDCLENNFEFLIPANIKFHKAIIKHIYE